MAMAGVTRVEYLEAVCQGIMEFMPRAGSRVVRIDPLHFLAGCRKKRLNQALSVTIANTSIPVS